MRKIGILLVVAVGLTALTVVPAAAAGGQPAGTGANACHELRAAGSGNPADPTVTLKINVGNPEQVLLAGNCDGGAIGFVDDGLSLDVSRPNGWSASGSWNFYDFCGGSNTGGPAIDVSDLFESGTHTVELTINNDCGGGIYASALYLIVRQHVG